MENIEQLQQISEETLNNANSIQETVILNSTNTEDIYNTLNSITPENAFQFSVGFIIFGIIMLIVGYIITSFIISRIFKKAGVKQSIAWIPIYNTWKILEMGDQKGFWAVLMFVPVINILALIFMILAMFNISKKFKKPDWFFILGIFVPIVWYGILAFDNSKWKGGKV